MSDIISLAQAQLWAPHGLTLVDVNRVLDQLHSRQIDDGDLYFESSRLESWLLEDGIIKEGNHSIDQGVGIRAISGEKTGFAYTEVLQPDALLKAAETARSISRSGQEKRVHIQPGDAHPNLYPTLNPLDSLAREDKVNLLKAVEQTARKADPRISQVMVSLVAAHDTVLVVSAEGQLSADVRPLIRMSVQVIVEQKGRREQGTSGGGARQSLDYFLQNDLAHDYAREAVRQALVNLEAIDAPAGSMPVVLGPGWPGVLLHEAVGHGLEGDFNRKGTSAFSGRIGEQVATSLCTVVDDATMENRRGSLSVDDEGTPGQYTTLIENGVLKNYMQDRLNARLMGTSSTGNGRRESYADLPMPRMTNTYMLPGESEPDEIIASIDNGLYAVNFGGGQVDITSGKFVFSASEAYLIENGRLGPPVKGATLIGNGPEVMNRISMVGNDLALDEGVGTCGKDGQSVPVGVGQPTLRIDELTVGGTAT